MSDSKHIIDLLNLMSNNLKESMENSITVVVIHFLYIGHTKIVSDILNKKTIWKDNLNGDYLKENHTITRWETPDVNYQEGDELPEGKEIGDRIVNAKRYCYHTDNIPEYEMIPNDGPDEQPKVKTDEDGNKIPLVVPDDAVVVSKDDDGNQLTRRIINPDYDESLEYVPREDRDEWNLIGLLGQIPITKGQPMADNWIKMKDVSDTVEMYLVK